MGNRVRRTRFGFGGPRRVQARPLVAGTERRRWRPPRSGAWLGWLATAGAVAVVAFLVGRAGSEVGIASPTPSPSAVPLTVIFGTELDKVTGEAANPTSRFRAGDTVAYSVRLEAPTIADQIFVEILRLEAGTGTVVQKPSRQGIITGSPLIAFTVPATRLLDAWGPGDYAMRMYLPGALTPFAAGGFTLVETPAAS